MSLVPLDDKKLRQLARIPADDGRRMYSALGTKNLTYFEAYDALTKRCDKVNDPLSPHHGKTIYSRDLMPRLLKLNQRHLARVDIRRLLFARGNEFLSDKNDQPFSFEPESHPSSPDAQSPSDLPLHSDGSPAATEQAPPSHAV